MGSMSLYQAKMQQNLRLKKAISTSKIVVAGENSVKNN